MAKPKSTPSNSKIPARGSTDRSKPKPVASSNRRSRQEAAARRRRNRLMAIGASAVVVVVIAVLVVVKITGGSSTASTVRTPVSAADMAQVSGVPISTMVAATTSANTGTVSPPTNLPPNTPALTSGGKPEVLYIGAEYCPYCAAQRWPLVMALSKFGTFANLTSTTSSSTDVNPNTPTFSFFGSTYSSPYLTFTSVELYDRAGKKLETPTPEQTNLINTYDAPPYTTGTAGAIPFIDLGGRFVVSGTQFDGAALSNMSFDTAVGYMTNGTTSTSEGGKAASAHLVGVICSLTNNQPSSVCSAVPASLKTGVTRSGNQGSSGGG